MPQGRKVNEKNPEMSKHYQFESLLSPTGGNADNRYTHRPSESGAVALALLAEVGGATAPAIDPRLKAAVQKAGKDLLANKGNALVVSGSNNPQIQIIVNAINEAIGANGTTIDWSAPILWRQGIDSDFATLVADMDGGKVGALLVYNANPAYNYYDADKFKSAIKKAKVAISFNDRLDETTELCKYIIPAPHFLESWGDAETEDRRVFQFSSGLRSRHCSRQGRSKIPLLKWSGSTVQYERLFSSNTGRIN